MRRYDTLRSKSVGTPYAVQSVGTPSVEQTPSMERAQLMERARSMERALLLFHFVASLCYGPRDFCLRIPDQRTDDNHGSMTGARV